MRCRKESAELGWEASNIRCRVSSPLRHRSEVNLFGEATT